MYGQDAKRTVAATDYLPTAYCHFANTNHYFTSTSHDTNGTNTICTSCHSITGSYAGPPEVA